MSIGIQEARPSVVRFERMAVQDMEASKTEGRYVAKDVDIACVTAAGSRDVYKQKVPQWLAQLQRDSNEGRLPPTWVRQYEESYKAWQSGQEMPLHGTPIKGWGMISASRQEELIRISVLTVEALAQLNDEGTGRLGMGGRQLKQKAAAWLEQLQDRGPMVTKMSDLQTENEHLKVSLQSLQDKVAVLAARQAVDVSTSDVVETKPTKLRSRLLKESAV